MRPNYTPSQLGNQEAFIKTKSRDYDILFISNGISSKLRPEWVPFLMKWMIYILY